MATVPSVPTFTAGSSPTYTTLNNLGYAVQFALTPPRAILQQTSVSPVSGGQSISATTATAIIFTVAVEDSDTGWSSSNRTRYTAQTPGYFMLDAVWQATAETSSGYRGCYFQVTTGSNNPGGSGHTTAFGAVRLPNVTSATGTNYTAIGSSIVSPYLYVLDYVEFFAYSSHSETTGFTDGGSYMTATLVSL